MAKKVIKKKVSTKKFDFPKKYFLFITVILVIGLIGYFGFKVIFAASVNNRLISRFAVIKELEKQGGSSVLETLILKSLIQQEAKKRKIVITNKELNDELAKLEKNITSQGTTLDYLLQQQGLTKKDLEDQVKLQLSLSKIVNSKVEVTDKEIDEYLTYATDFTRKEAKDAITKQKQQQKIEKFLRDLKSKAKINYFIKY